jgi:hypothetical protein
LSDEEKTLLEKLTKKANEPEGPPANVNFNLDLSSDSAWERAKKLGIVRDDPPAAPEGGEGEQANGTPNRGKGYFGG